MKGVSSIVWLSSHFVGGIVYANVTYYHQGHLYPDFIVHSNPTGNDQPTKIILINKEAGIQTNLQPDFQFRLGCQKQEQTHERENGTFIHEQNQSLNLMINDNRNIILTHQSGFNFNEWSRQNHHGTKNDKIIYGWTYQISTKPIIAHNVWGLKTLTPRLNFTYNIEEHKKIKEEVFNPKLKFSTVGTFRSKHLKNIQTSVLWDSHQSQHKGQEILISNYGIYHASQYEWLANHLIIQFITRESDTGSKRNTIIKKWRYGYSIKSISTMVKLKFSFFFERLKRPQQKQHYINKITSFSLAYDL